MSAPTETRFRCPGESYFIDRPIHLARLAGGYATCRGCLHRFDAGLRPVKATAADARLAHSNPERTDSADAEPEAACAEGPLGIARNQIDAPLVRRYAAALGTALRRRVESAGGVPRVAVATDGRWLSAELVAAAGDGLALSGCRVVESGAATAASLARLVHRHGLDGGLLVGNSSGAPQIVSLKCWGPASCPWSAGGQLDDVTALFAGAPERSSRRSGGLERIDPGPEYRQELADLFHGLRPLRFVLDTSSLPLAEHLRQLAGNSACQIAGPRLPAAGKPAQSADRKGKTAKAKAGSPSTALTTAAAYRGRRGQRLREQVLDESADFGLWIDGDGESLDLIDQRGRPVNAERLLFAFARQLSAEAKSAGVVVEAEASPAAHGQLTAAGTGPIESASRCESMFVAMQRSGAALGGGPSGRIWFGGELPQPDALRTLGELLQLLSQSDRPLSEVLEGSD